MLLLWGIKQVLLMPSKKNGNGAQLNLDGEQLLGKINKKMQSLIESTQPQYKGGVLLKSMKKK